MLCEMCGNDVPSVAPVKVERSILQLCPSCAKFGEPLTPAPPAPSDEVEEFRPTAVARPLRPVGPRRTEERDVYQEMGEMELAPDWPHRIRVARETLKWTPEDLGKKLNEKKSVVLKLEAGAIHPPDELVRKVEHLLRIRLRAEPGAAAATPG